jgi:hypothetical protein
MTDFIVKGERRLFVPGEEPVDHVGPLWEKFTETFKGADKGEARWRARRSMAPGKKAGDLDPVPGPTAAGPEYDRLTENVRITSVEEA